MNWWAYDGESVEFFNDPEDARRFALISLDHHRDRSDEGWLEEEVSWVQWGRVLEKANQTNVVRHLDSCNSEDCDPDCKLQTREFDFFCDYDLVPVTSGLTAFALDQLENTEFKHKWDGPRKSKVVEYCTRCGVLNNGSRYAGDECPVALRRALDSLIKDVRGDNG